MENLSEIRCPFQRKSKKDENLYKCNRLCLKATPTSSGEAMCRSCHLAFEFVVDSNGDVITYVRVKKEY